MERERERERERVRDRGWGRETEKKRGEPHEKWPCAFVYTKDKVQF